jgi:ketopantoate reductase
MNRQQHITDIENIGIIGIGNMGGGMARCLLGKGYSVHVVDIDAVKTDELSMLGATVHANASTFPDTCKAVIVCVVDSPQIETVLPSIQRGCTVVLCPTIAPEDTEAFAKGLIQRGLQAIDAPMSGGPQRAAEGTMSLMVACTDSVFEQHQGLLNDLSNQVFRISQRVGDGARMKLCNNLLAGNGFGANHGIGHCYSAWRYAKLERAKLDRPRPHEPCPARRLRPESTHDTFGKRHQACTGDGCKSRRRLLCGHACVQSLCRCGI